MSYLSRRSETLHKWKLTKNPFRETPPEDWETLSRLFYGRERELEKAIPTLYEGRNISVSGLWGVGKTTFILYLLQRLQREVASLNESMLILYLGQFPGDKPEDLFRALLFQLSERTANQNEEAKRVYDALRGFQTSFSETLQVEGKVDFKLIGASGSMGKGSDEDWQLEHSYQILLRLLDVAEQHYGKVIIAIDDLDKKEPKIVSDLLDNAIDLFRRGQGKRGFIWTGRFTTQLQDTTNKMLGLFSEDITLHRMSTDDLRHIAVNYLNTARLRPSGEVFPFTDEVIERIAEYAYHIPRQFNRICERILRRGAMASVDQIDIENFQTIWRNEQVDFALNLTPDIRRLLYIAKISGGLSPDIDDDSLDRLGVETFVELLPKLRELEGTLLIRQEDGRLLPSPLLPDAESSDSEDETSD